MTGSVPSVTHATAAGISYCRREGSGRCLVCLHGIGSNAGSFLPMLGVGSVRCV